jgi:flagellar hook assembly protein FlgD
MGSSEIIVIKPSPTPMEHPLLGNSQVRRNKFRASLGEYAAILYKTRAQEKVRIEIFDRLGHSVALLQDGAQGAGNYEIHWFGHDGNGDLSPSGIYLIHIHTEHYDERHKVVFIR